MHCIQAAIRHQKAATKKSIALDLILYDSYTYIHIHIHMNTVHIYIQIIHRYIIDTCTQT
jgi:hypothetical protein